jgi:hypothetical protein
MRQQSTGLYLGGGGEGVLARLSLMSLPHDAAKSCVMPVLRVTTALDFCVSLPVSLDSLVIGSMVNHNVQ